MKLQLFCTALLAIFITGCSNDRQQAEKMLPQINLNTEYPEKEIWFQDVAERKNWFCRILWMWNIFRWKLQRKYFLRVQ